MKKWFGLVVLVVMIASSIAAVHPVSAGKGNPDHITFVKLSDIEFRDESGQGITMTKGWLKNLLKVEWGFGSYTNATLVWDGKRLTVYLQDDTKHDGRWFALNEKILQKVGIDPDAVSVSLDTQAPAEVVKRLDEDGKWFYFYIDHFTVRYVTFEAEEGYVELSDFGWQNYTKLIEPDPYCEDCAVFAPLDDLVDNGDGTGSTTIYVNGQAGTATVYFNSTTGYPKLVSGKIGNALEFDGGTNEYVAVNVDLSALSSLTVAYFFRVDSVTWGDRIWNYGNDHLSQYVFGTTLNTYIYTTEGLQSRSLHTIEFGKVYFIVTTYQFSSTQTFITSKLYDVETHTLVSEATKTANPASLPVGSRLAIGGAHYQYNLDGMLDEFRMYFNKTLTDDEIKLLLHLGRYRYALYRGDEPSLPSYLNSALFCPLDDLDTTNNVTTCYLDGTAMSATVYFNSTTGYPKLTSGVIRNAFEFGGTGGTDTQGRVLVTTDVLQTDEFTITFWFKKNSTNGPTEILFSGYFYDRAIYLDSNGKLAAQITLNETTYIVSLDGNYVDGQWHMVVFRWSNTTGVMSLSIDDGKEYKERTEVRGALKYTSIDIAIGANKGGQRSFDGDIDEVRVYQKILSREEEALLYHLSRYKFATLSAPSASFDGSQFLVNVTAQLPGDGGSYLLPAPINAVSSYSSAGQIGNFTFLQVGSSSEASFQVPVSKDLTPPAGINLLAWMYNDEIYVTGRSDQFPLIATVMNLPKGVWGVQNGRVVKNVVYKDYTKLIIANITSPDYVSRLPNLFVEPRNEYVNVTVIEHSPTRVEVNASAPTGESVIFTIGGLYGNAYYKLLIDNEEKATLLSSGGGWVSFEVTNWSTHIITLRVATSSEVFSIAKSNFENYSATFFKFIGLGMVIGSVMAILGMVFMIRNGEVGVGDVDTDTLIRNIIGVGAAIIVLGIIILILSIIYSV